MLMKVNIARINCGASNSDLEHLTNVQIIHDVLDMVSKKCKEIKSY